MNPQGTIITAIIVSGAVLTIRTLETGSLSPRTYLALGVVAVFLMVMAQFAPEVAVGFAILLMVAVLISGQAELSGLLSLGKRGK